MKLLHRRMLLGTCLLPAMPAMLAGVAHAQDLGKPLTYRHIKVEQADGRVISMTPVPAEPAPRWALAFGRGNSINGYMPMSISADLGKTWTYKASPFPPIGGGQRLVLKRLREGPLLFVSFTSGDRSKPEANGMTFTDQKGKAFTGHGMYAAVSFDDGKTWPVRKLLTPGEGEFDGGAWTRQFAATPTRAEHAGYLAATQTPDGVIHLISSRLYYRFDLPWLVAGTSGGGAEPPGKPRGQRTIRFPVGGIAAGGARPAAPRR